MSESGRDAATLAHVQVVRGTPDDVELAALVAGLVAASAPGDDEPLDLPGARTAWSDGSRNVPHAGGAWRPGPDAWRRSLRG